MRLCPTMAVPVTRLSLRADGRPLPHPGPNSMPPAGRYGPCQKSVDGRLGLLLTCTLYHPYSHLGASNWAHAFTSVI
jgi:hypothetical protein